VEPRADVDATELRVVDLPAGRVVNGGQVDGGVRGVDRRSPPA
jgi:hypothetical protein